MALLTWASPRTTHDIDIRIALPAERIAEFRAHFSPERVYVDREAMDTMQCQPLAHSAPAIILSF